MRCLLSEMLSTAIAITLKERLIMLEIKHSSRKRGILKITIPNKIIFIQTLLYLKQQLK